MLENGGRYEVPAPAIVLRDPNGSHYTSKLLTCEQMRQLNKQSSDSRSVWDISRALDIGQLSCTTLSLEGSCWMGGIFQLVTWMNPELFPY